MDKQHRQTTPIHHTDKPHTHTHTHKHTYIHITSFLTAHIDISSATNFITNQFKMNSRATSTVHYKTPPRPPVSTFAPLTRSHFPPSPALPPNTCKAAHKSYSNTPYFEPQAVATKKHLRSIIFYFPPFIEAGNSSTTTTTNKTFRSFTGGRQLIPLVLPELVGPKAVTANQASALRQFVKWTSALGKGNGR
ncbi:hypothetical protein BGX38DRAFT_901639 [Terfezia claveryi]|nr:hypothetical protein BGX38DRAFT_901639 [Terfezia claveryi]